MVIEVTRLRLLSAALILAACVGASPVLAEDLPAQEFACAKEAEALLKSWGSKHVWFRRPDPLPGTREYASPTETFGTWVRLRQEQGATEAARVSGAGHQRVRWQAPDCVPSMAAPGFYAPPRPNAFTDAKLKTLLDSGESGLIYVWSPSFYYSMVSYPVVKKIAKELGMKFIPILGTSRHLASAKSQLSRFDRAYEERLNESVELLSRDTLDHFPSIVIYSNKKLGDLVLRAALNESAYRERLTRMLKDLNHGS